MENVQLKSVGIICDNPNCDYFDNTVIVNEIKNFINKSCPKCGDNLLTETDFNRFKRGHIGYLPN